jgi:hypothetical protein
MARGEASRTLLRDPLEGQRLMLSAGRGLGGLPLPLPLPFGGRRTPAARFAPPPPRPGADAAAPGARAAGDTAETATKTATAPGEGPDAGPVDGSSRTAHLTTRVSERRAPRLASCTCNHVHVRECVAARWCTCHAVAGPCSL